MLSFEGRTRGLDSSNLSDPKVVITMEDETKNSYPATTTQVCQRTINPEWNQEAVIVWPSNKAWLRLNVLDHHRIFSDKPLGTAFFDLSRLEMGETREVWLPLVDSKTANKNECPFVTAYAHKPAISSDASSEPQDTQTTSDASAMIDASPLPYFSATALPGSAWGHIRALINISYYPGPSHCSLTTLKRMRVVIEKQVYRPGDLVRGVVYYNSTTPKSFSRVNAYCFGKTSVQWSESAGKTSIAYRGAMEHFKESKTIIAPIQGALRLDKSTFCAAFEFQLPNVALPASNGGHYMQVSTANSEYRIGSTAFYADGTAEDAFSKFLVLPHHEDAQTVALVTNVEPNAPTPVTVAFERSCDARGIKYKLLGPRVVYAQKLFSITVSVENTTNAPIQRLAFKLAEMMCVHANRAGTWFQKRSMRTISAVYLAHVKETRENLQVSPQLPILPGESRTFTVTMNIPDTVFNSVLDTDCPLLSIQHAFTVSNVFDLDQANVADFASFSVLVSGSPFPEPTYPDRTAIPAAQFLETSKPVTLAEPFPPQVPLEDYYSLSMGRQSSNDRLQGYAKSNINIQSFVFPHNAPETFPFLAPAPIIGRDPAEYALSILPVPSEHKN